MKKTNTNLLIRKCIACQTHRQKKEFFRIVRENSKNTKDNTKIFIDKTLKSNGRGAYICKDLKCVNLAKKKQSLSKAFRKKVENNIYELLENELNNLQF